MGCVACGNEKLGTFDWLSDLPKETLEPEIVEVHFKNTRKAFYTNELELEIKIGDKVTVEAINGHDIGVVSLTGRLATTQFDKKVPNKDRHIPKTIYRKSTPKDIEAWQLAQKLDQPTMVRARKIVSELGLIMKISDVEHQGDGKKATFYYIADGRVDFRELIKVFSSEFRVKIEMLQIGVRQEAGMIGSLGSCGRTLCCSSWRTRLPSIQQSVIQAQNLSSNIDKYMGHCGKLKCCLTYEVDNYIDARKDFPKELLELDVREGTLYPFKTDVLKKTIWYSTKSNVPENLIEIGIEKIKEILTLNKKAITPKIAELKPQTQVHLF